MQHKLVQAQADSRCPAGVDTGGYQRHLLSNSPVAVNWTVKVGPKQQLF